MRQVKDLLAVERVQARKRKVLSASRGEEMYTLGKLRHQIKSFSPLSEFRRVKRPSRLRASIGKIKSFSSRTSSGMAQRVEEVWKVAKVGSKRTPSQPVFVLKSRRVKRDPKRRLCSQIKKQLPKHEARKS